MILDISPQSNSIWNKIKLPAYESKSNYSCEPFNGAQSKCNLFSKAGEDFSLKNCSEEFSSILEEYWAEHYMHSAQ